MNMLTRTRQKNLAIGIDSFTSAARPQLTREDWPSHRRRPRVARESSRKKPRSQGITALLLGMALASVASAQQPILHYSFDDQANPTANDGTLGASYVGSINGGAQFAAFGGGSALVFQNGTSVEATGGSSALNIGDNDFSIFVRLQVGNLSGNPGSDQSIVTKESGPRGYSITMDGSTGVVVFQVARNGANQAIVLGSTSISDQVPHEILAVRDDGYLLLYIDGQLEGQAPVQSYTTANSGEFIVGTASGLQFLGFVDDVQVYDEAMTPADIVTADCNSNGVSDDVEISSGIASDCNGNGIIDECEAGIVLEDCNANGICDAFELATGLVPDINSNGVPDDCEPWQALPYQINEMVVFGDSLSDTGNLFALTGCPTSPPYFNGHFSNGAVWVEYLAGYLGLSDADVTNYAFGGAMTGHGNNVVPNAPGLLDEVELYRQQVLGAGIIGQIGLLQLKPGRRRDPETLFVIWIGANDFESATDLESLVSSATANIEQTIQSLYDLGARRFLVANLPDLGATPKVQLSNDPKDVQNARIATIGFNANLAWSLAKLEDELGIDAVLYDVFSLYEGLLSGSIPASFIDVTNPCIDSATGSLCNDPSKYLFWDDIHPTTDAHRQLALVAQASLISGGKALPVTPCLDSTCPQALVTIQSPQHGDFLSSEFVTVTGYVSTANVSADQLTLAVNGAPVLVAPDGSFTTGISLMPGTIDSAIVASVDLDGVLLDNDRIVVFQGPSIDVNTTVPDAVRAHLSTVGIGSLVDELTGRLIANGVLDVRAHLLASNPISSDFSGTTQYSIDVVDAGFLCSSIDMSPQSDGTLHVALNLHDLFVDYDFHGWLNGIPDPGLDCSGRIVVSRISVFTDLAFSPSMAGAPGEVDVTQVTPLFFNLLSFDHSGSCATATDFLDALPKVELDVQQLIQQAIGDGLMGLNQQNWLATELEDVLAAISISGGLSSALGVSVSGDIGAIGIDPAGIDVAFDALLNGGQTSAAAYAVPTGPLPSNSLDSQGNPYDVRLSVALQSLNQLLLAKSDLLPAEILVQQLDVGAGPQWLTAGLLQSLVPQFDALDPNLPVALSLRPTLSPMFLGQSNGCSFSDLYLGQVIAEVRPLAPAAGIASLLTVSLDIRGCLSLAYLQSTSMLEASLALGQSAGDATLLDNPLQVDETGVLLLLESLLPALIETAGPFAAEFPLPSLEGLSLTATDFAGQNGYASLFLNADSSYARPDLVVETINLPAAIDVNVGFTVTGAIKNVGDLTAFGGVKVGTSLSPDTAFMNGNDTGLAENFVSFGSGLMPGDSIPFSVGVGPIPWAAPVVQTLFVLADVPALPGGTGNICETMEGNNHLGVQVLTTSPDAYVVSVVAPTGAVGGVGPLPYRVRVGRNTVGLANLQVPIDVRIGSPAVTWSTVFVNVPKGQEVEVDVFVPTPDSFGVPGQVNQFQVLACSTLNADSNVTNNCVMSSVAVEVPWWDLQLSIVGPSSVSACGTANWTVRATNVGNFPSPNVCGSTMICVNSGAGNNSQCAPSYPFQFFSVNPGDSADFVVSNYQLWYALPGSQYIKAQITGAPGCPTDNLPAGNYVQKFVTVLNNCP